MHLDELNEIITQRKNLLSNPFPYTSFHSEFLSQL